MGSYFRGMSKQEWKRVLPNLWSYLDGEIDSVLKFSYDALCDEEKKLFLYIACFLNGKRIEIVEGHLAKKFFDLRQRLQVLAEKSLISIHEYSITTVGMHSLLVQFGKEIVRKSNREPAQRQFLVNDEDICEVLIDPPAVSKSVIGIYSRDIHTWYNLNVNERAFEGMRNLQFLRFEADDAKYSTMESLSGFLKYISPKLQLLCWPYSPLTSLPFSINLEFFVELDMPYSKLEKLWEGIKVLRNLKKINLLHSKNLKELPDLSTATNLYDLDISDCSSLVKLPSSIGNAINLKYLNLSHCSSLMELPSSIGNAINLRYLNLSHCSSLEELSPWVKECSRLRYLHLNGMKNLVSLPQLPDSLAVLVAENCKSLKVLGCSFRNPNIRLDFRNCFNLNEEARDVIIQTSTSEILILPGGEVPACFTYRAPGSSVTVQLNERPPHTSTKFKACILLINRGYKFHDSRKVDCYITSNYNARTRCISNSRDLYEIMTKHMYIFDVEAEEVTSTELIFEFRLHTNTDGPGPIEIKECGILFELQVDEDSDESFRGSDEER